MSLTLLFCVAEEAVPLIRKGLEFDFTVGGAKIFHLVQSRAAVSSRPTLKCELKEDERFESEFLGASLQDCQDWALENQSCGRFKLDVIVIADKRSAEDGTLLLQHYYRGEPVKIDGEDMVLEGVDTWYDFRIDFREVVEPIAMLAGGFSGLIYDIYMGRKTELTDENGVFDVDGTRRICHGEPL